MRACCPLHITGFFAVQSNKSIKKNLRIRSLGCGVIIDEVAVTDVVEGSGKIYINDELSPAHTTKTVVDSLTNQKVDVRTRIGVPMGCGLGTSGAGALSTAIALNELFSLSLSGNDLCIAASTAEIINNTGLGDVIAQSTGGVVIRGFSGLDRIATKPYEISYSIFGPLTTSEILRDRHLMKRVNLYGRESLKQLMRRPIFDEFMMISKRFATHTELISDKAKDAVEAVESHGGRASMIMLGDAVFGLNCADVLSEFGSVFTSKITNCGAKLL